MKAIKFFFVSVIALTFVACSSAEDERFEDNSSNFESIKSLYGIESVSNVADIGNVPSVTAEEMQGVLESLRQNGNVIRECKSENVEGYFGEDGDRQSVRMIAEYQARTRAGAFLEEFALCVSLNFNVDEDTVYYIELPILLLPICFVGKDMALLYQQLLEVETSLRLSLTFISV